MARNMVEWKSNSYFAIVCTILLMCLNSKINEISMYNHSKFSKQHTYNKILPEFK